MKNIFKIVLYKRFFYVVLYLFTTTFPLYAQWVQTNGLYSSSIYCFAVSDSNLFVGTGSDSVYFSTNKGASWSAASTGLKNTSFVNALAISGKNLFAGVGYGGVYLSTNNGTSWTEVNSGLPANTMVKALTFSGSNLLAGTWRDGAFLSTNNGTTWSQVIGLLESTSVEAFADSGTNLYAGTNFVGASAVSLSETHGGGWTVTSNFTTNYIYALAISGANLFAGTTGGGGIFLSTNNGKSWVAIDSGLTNTSVPSLAVAGKNIFAGTLGGGVFLSTNNGTNWVNVGLPNINVDALVVCGTNLFAGTIGDGVWRRPLSQMVTGVAPITSTVPKEFAMSQNYPNPFNPSTVINYQVTQTGNVALKVYDLLGREVAVLVNEVKSIGSYKAIFEAVNLPSGEYFYTIEMNHQRIAKKMLILK